MGLSLTRKAGDVVFISPNITIIIEGFYKGDCYWRYQIGKHGYVKNIFRFCDSEFQTRIDSDVNIKLNRHNIQSKNAIRINIKAPHYRIIHRQEKINPVES